MKVTHVYRYSYPPLHGGIEQHIHTLVHRLKHSVQTEVLVSGSRPDYQLDEGVPIRSAGTCGHVSGAPISPLLPYWMRRSNPDLFHFHAPNPTGEMSYLLAACDTPSVVTYHMETVRYARMARYYRPFLEEFLRRTARIIVSTPQHIAQSAILQKYREKCRIIPFGIDTQRYEATPIVIEKAQQLRARYGERLVLFIGKLRHYKGLDYLLRAMQQVSGHLLIVGEGEEKNALLGLAKELEISDRITWLSHLENEEFLATLHACDLLVLPSVYQTETFGLVQLEAHACGKPVICTALGTGVEYVNQHERTGLVVPPRDEQALAGAICRLLDDPDYRCRLGETARARARTEFTQERMTADILAVYQEVLGYSEASARANVAADVALAAAGTGAMGGTLTPRQHP